MNWKSIVQPIYDATLRPYLPIVETHPERGVSAHKTIDAMEAAGYVIIHQLAVGGPKSVVVARRSNN